MQTRLFFAVFLACLLSVAAYGQKFELDSEGRGIAVTPEVQRLMNEADRIIAQTAPERAVADKRMAEAEAALQAAIADKKIDLLRLHEAKINYMSTVSDMIRSRLASSGVVHKATMAYFDNVIAIANKKIKPAKDGYSEWQEKALAAKKFAAVNHNLMEKTDVAIAAARERETERFNRFQRDVERMRE